MDIKSGKKASEQNITALKKQVDILSLTLAETDKQLNREKDENNALKSIIKESNEKWTSLMDSFPGFVTIADRNGTVQYVNRSVAGISAEKAIGMNIHDFEADGHHDASIEAMERVFESGQTGRYRMRGLGPQNNMVWYEAYYGPVMKNSRVSAIVINTIEITEPNMTEEALRKSKEKYKMVVDNAMTPIEYLTPEGIITFVNKIGAKNLNSTQDELIGKSIFEIMPDMADITRDRIGWVLESNTSLIFEDLITIPSGTIWYLTNFQPVSDYKGRITAIQLVSIDITKRKKAEKALLESEYRYKTLFEESRDAVYITARDGRYLEVNPFMLELFGYEKEEMMAKNAGDHYVNHEDRKTFQNEIEKNGSVRDYEVVLSKKDGSQLHCLLTTTLRKDNQGKTLGYHGIIRDVTHQKKLEFQLQQAQKMEAIGTLASGIAHDFNNILSPIIGFTEMAMHDSPADSIIRKNLNQVLKATYRARDLIDQILTFSRQSGQERKPVRINLIIKEALKLLGSTLPSTIRISQKIDTECGSVMAAPTQIHQIIMNLCTNAYHAMSKNGGILSVGLNSLELKQVDIASHPGISVGQYNVLTVSDTGHGMNQNVVNRIFEPYFTTKEKGEGSGMGLSIVHGIVISNGGHINVKSTPGKGTTFLLYLPQLETEPITPDIYNIESLPCGKEHILFVDDEILIAEMAKQMLERLGYKVTIQTSSIDALYIFENDHEKIDLVITDLTMPDMTGEKLSRELIKIKPDLPIILCTGFSELMSTEKAASLGIKDFLLKPVIMKDLAIAVRKVLD